VPRYLVIQSAKGIKARRFREGSTVPKKDPAVDYIMIDAKTKEGAERTANIVFGQKIAQAAKIVEGSKTQGGDEDV